MNQQEQEKMDLEFYKAYAKDKTISRSDFIEAYQKKHIKAKATRANHFNVTAPSEDHKKIYTALETYCKKFPNVTTPNLVIWGKTGTGKTFLTEMISKTLTDRDFWVENTTAFNMVHAFRKYDNSFGRDTETIDNFLECDLLVIDDLGSEPKNFNANEHIYNIINERLRNQRAFIITTNFNPLAINEKYDQRIASRMFADKTSTVIELDGKDLRLNPVK